LYLEPQLRYNKLTNFKGAPLSYAIAHSIDWDTAKIQYEILGDSLSKIALTQGISLEGLERVSCDEQWERVKDSSSAYNTYLAGVVNQHRAKISLAMLYRELEMFPHVAELETLLLDKIKQTTALLVPSDSKTPSSLRSLSSALNSITERQLLLKQQLSDLFGQEQAPEVNINLDIGIDYDQARN
jgi:hypothetical protein